MFLKVCSNAKLTYTMQACVSTRIQGQDIGYEDRFLTHMHDG